MPKKKQNRSRWIAKIRRDVGPYFKVTVYLFCFCVCFVVNTISSLAFMLVICMT